MKCPQKQLKESQRFLILCAFLCAPFCARIVLVEKSIGHKFEAGFEDSSKNQPCGSFWPQSIGNIANADFGTLPNIYIPLDC